MTNHTDSNQTAGPLDELVTELLGCGAVLSQIVSGMVRFAASGRSTPNLAPIPDVAHSLISDVLADVVKRYSKRDVKIAAAIIRDATETIGEEIFFVDPEFIDEALRDEEPDRRANGAS